MSDTMVPSYRLHRPPSGVPWRMMAMAGGVLAFVGAGAAGWWAIQRIGTRSVPVVEADPRPFKVRPGDPGGLRVPNQTELVLERPGQRSQAAAQANRPAGLAPEAETPNIGGLRAAVAPPPVVAPAPQAARPGAAPTQPPAAAPAAPTPAPAQPQVAARAGAPAPQAAPPAASAPQQQAAAPATRAVPPPAPPPPAAAPARPAPAATGRVQVQFAALATEDAARTEWDRVARRAPDLLQGRAPVVTRFDREGQAPLYRLRTGGFADLEAARDFCEQVRTKGATCIPIR